MPPLDQHLRGEKNMDTIIAMGQSISSRVLLHSLIHVPNLDVMSGQETQLCYIVKRLSEAWKFVGAELTENC